jgi:hypothetical protein
MYNGNGNQGDVLKHTLAYKVKKEYGSLFNFFQQTKPEKTTVTRLLEHFSQNDLTDAFLADIGTPGQQNEILTKYVFDITQPLKDIEVITLNDLLTVTKNAHVRDFMVNSLKQAINGSVRVSQKSKITASVLAAALFRDARDVPEWAQPAVAEYASYLPETKIYEEASAFREIQGVQTNVQAYFFYNDQKEGKPESTWDGHNSFKNFIEGLGGSVEWDAHGVIKSVSVGKNIALEDKGAYIVLRKTNNETKREIVIYANKPDRTDEEVATTMKGVLEEQKPQTVVHRGHSYHARKTIQLLPPTVSLVSLGSCGGAKNISDVLAKVPTAQVMATRNTGTMLVNDPLMRAVDSSLLAEGSVDWEAMQIQMSAVFGRGDSEVNSRWTSYQLPHKNKTAHLIAALASALSANKLP